MGKQIYYSNDTWTCPTGVTATVIECWGGGGSGSNIYSGDGFGSDGGGGGAYAKSTIVSVPGRSYSVVVGTGGSAAGAGFFGQAGLDSYVYYSSTTYCRADAGSGGGSKPGAGGTTSSSTGDTKYAGGAGGNVSSGSTGGGGGSSAGTASTGSTASGIYGATAPAGGGDGGDGGGEGSPGSFPGGGGGGGGANSSYSGAGADGFVIITWTDPADPPTISTTVTAYSIEGTTATSGGQGLDDGGASITAKGVVTWTSSPPTITSYTDKTNDGTGTSNYTSYIDSLSANTLYYYRAYATNSMGTGYGPQYSFTTDTTPTVTTTAVSAIEGNTATGGGNCTSAGGGTVSAKGLVWSTSTNPTISSYPGGGKTNDGTGTGSYTSYMTSLSLNTTYHCRAYATNGTGTTYGSEVDFTTDNYPTVTTTSITSITPVSASSGGNCTSDGGGTVSAKGVVWNTVGTPTISSYDGKTNDGTGTGSYTSSLTGLVHSTTYHVRAYATNGVGTAYGSEVDFATSDPSGSATVSSATRAASVLAKETSKITAVSSRVSTTLSTISSFLKTIASSVLASAQASRVSGVSLSALAKTVSDVPGFFVNKIVTPRAKTFSRKIASVSSSLSFSATASCSKTYFHIHAFSIASSVVATCSAIAWGAIGVSINSAVVAVSTKGFGISKTIGAVAKASVSKVLLSGKTISFASKTLSSHSIIDSRRVTASVRAASNAYRSTAKRILSSVFASSVVPNPIIGKVISSAVRAASSRGNSVINKLVSLMTRTSSSLTTGLSKGVVVSDHGWLYSGNEDIIVRVSGHIIQENLYGSDQILVGYPCDILTDSLSSSEELLIENFVSLDEYGISSEEVKKGMSGCFINDNGTGQDLVGLLLSSSDVCLATEELSVSYVHRDSANTNESVSIDVSVSVYDSGYERTESVTVDKDLLISEAASGTDTVTAASMFMISDSGVGSETVGYPSIDIGIIPDGGSGTEDFLVHGSITVVEGAYCDDSFAIFNVVTISESGVATEEEILHLPLVEKEDSGSLQDDFLIEAFVSDTDSGSSSETLTVLKTHNKTKISGHCTLTEYDGWVRLGRKTEF